jgi:hypothetical protein
MEQRDIDPSHIAFRHMAACRRGTGALDGYERGLCVLLLGSSL